ncbi:hypothetical protein EGT74_01585 [Chitinophaga lutea]|uniref:DNA-binding protein n=1 Tax=Chitinophaga lutea TaxID=2488634 RepID=A0A3N4PXV5_9BACT|nr:hypothetical protein [Chitinophaga lutea]RPE12275.1 hypothetical protein EGT74_01585 [Chitinophaga lutea]
MALLKHINRLKYVDFMIKRKATGDLKSFADKNGLCKRAMASVLYEMKELGFPIKFDRARGTYYYDEDGGMVKQLFVTSDQVLSREQVALIGNVETACFSEVNVFQLCPGI